MHGSKPGERRGGRKKGVPNRASAKRLADLEASGLTPLNYMLSILQDEGRPTVERFEAAKAAAPYIHAKLSTIEAKVEADVTTSITRIELIGVSSGRR